MEMHTKFLLLVDAEVELIFNFLTEPSPELEQNKRQIRHTVELTRENTLIEIIDILSHHILLIYLCNCHHCHPHHPLRTILSLVWYSFS